MSASSLVPSHGDGAAKLYHRRLLLDIHELVTEPYPKITLHPCEDDIYTACLVLCPDDYPPLHLSLRFPHTYPVQPPYVSMDSSVQHPNVYGSFICATILKVGEEYTPAYTLKGIAIQLLSFFDSDSLEQEDYDGKQDLASYRDTGRQYLKDTYECKKCQFRTGNRSRRARKPPAPTSFDARVGRSLEQWPVIHSSIGSATHPSPQRTHTSDSVELNRERQVGQWGQQALFAGTREGSRVGFNIDKLPNEILLMIIEHLDDFEHLTNFSRAWPRVSRIIRDFDVIRQRELQCFCLKMEYKSTKLGVGVLVDRGQVSSEFDLISEDAVVHMGVRNSIQNIRFSHWLPIPISRPHWNRVRGNAHTSLAALTSQLRTTSSVSVGVSGAHLLFTFMNDIVVRLNQTTEKLDRGDGKKSTLRHASEKAIESYFHLFHLLVCLATENPDIVQQANKLLRDFEGGKRSKTDCPNLGHLLVALLISDVPVTDTLRKAIITEAVTRNVVWLLDDKGAGRAELSYMERDPVSVYRLDQTFQGSRTSYRLLMFSELFRRTARPSSRAETLTQVRDGLYARHGGPPRGAAARLAAEVRRLHAVDGFPAFLREMGLRHVPSAQSFTAVLRGAVEASMAAGYSRWALDQRKAMRLRFTRDHSIQLTREERAWVAGGYLDHTSSQLRASYSFFPNRRTSPPARGGHASEGGRGRGHGRGRGRGRGRGH
ncbi:putative ubiquitin-conjugating enzyme family protein [Rosellinia necatrix]|uniref:Putative ubiquitin-conjugating enzyme family protein n=1 Tax=Rosellinia necatrix TaxID=77044 RepID=A0A1W2TF41_ROSNE|nr:putative ubiquitin-conjugating enzyme family protein [Rosellinia necatrix]